MVSTGPVRLLINAEVNVTDDTVVVVVRNDVCLNRARRRITGNGKCSSKSFSTVSSTACN